jgi:hypothetical protein
MIIVKVIIICPNCAHYESRQRDSEESCNGATCPQCADEMQERGS